MAWSLKKEALAFAFAGLKALCQRMHCYSAAIPGHILYVVLIELGAAATAKRLSISRQDFVV
jgi:hypothetical protein